MGLNTPLRERLLAAALSGREAVPSNWLDPLLTGPDKALHGEPGTWGCPDIERLLNGIRERIATTPQPGDGWRPIAEAPKDGTLFLCWVSAERWSQEDGGGSGRSADTSEVDFGQWRHFDTGGAFVNMMGQIGDMQDITHWMPLPTAPSAEGV